MRIPQQRRWTALLLSAAAMLAAITVWLPATPANAAPTADDLVLEFTTTAARERVEIGLFGAFTDVNIQWDAINSFQPWNRPSGDLVSFDFIYENPGTHEVVISGTTLTGFGTKLPDGSCTSPVNAANLTRIVQWGTLGLTSLDCMGYQRTGLTSVPSTLPSGITSLVSAFEDARNFDRNISGWNVSAVTSTSKMFKNAHAFNNGGVPLTWTTSSLTDTSYTFQSAFAFNQPIGGWNLSNVTNTDGMFNVATSFNQDISGWDVSRVETMNGLFEFAFAFDQDLSSWATESVTSLNATFRGAYAFTNGGVALNWDTGNVTDMGLTFSLAPLFNQNITSWDTSNVASFAGMFAGAQAFNQDITGWDTSSAQNLNGMFQNATAFNYSLANWDIGTASSMTDFFSDAGISNANYSATLIGWAAQTVQPNVRLDASAQAITCPAIAAHEALRAAPNTWTINDVAPTLNCSSDNGGGELARTGQDSLGLAFAAMLLVLFGGALATRAGSKLKF